MGDRSVPAQRRKPFHIPWPLKVLLGLLLVVATIIGALNLPPVTRRLGAKAAQLAEARTGLTVSCGAAHVLLTGVRLTELEVARGGKPLASFESLSIQPLLGPLFQGDLQIRSLEGQGFVFFVPEQDEKKEPSSGEKRSSLKEKLARVLNPDGVTFTFAEGRVVKGELPRPELELPLSELILEWPQPGQWPVRATLSLAPRDGKGELTVSATTLGELTGLRAEVKGAGLPLEPFRAQLEAILPAKLRQQLEPLLKRIPHLPALGGNFTLELDRTVKSVSLRGEVAVKDLYLQDERLATVPVGPLELVQHATLTAYLPEKRLVVEKWYGRVNRARYELESYVESVDGDILFTGTFALRDTPYQDLVDSIPEGVAPALAGVKLGGALDLTARVEGNLSDLEHLTTDFEADWTRLKLEEPSKPLRGAEPLSDFVYVPFSPDGIRREFRLGRSAPGWSALEALPRYLVHALLASEDITFFQHQGFDPEGLKLALKVNLKAGRAIRGGSTITQQLAKNLFLTRERTAIRKLQEAVLAWELEQVLKKRGILEYYLNIIEWGPGFYGIGKAAAHYFDKSPSELTIKEAAYLCTIIPNPVRYYVYFQRGELTERWSSHVNALLNRMRAWEYLTEEEYQLALEEPLYFRGSPRVAVDVSAMEAEDELERAQEVEDLSEPERRPEGEGSQPGVGSGEEAVTPAPEGERPGEVRPAEGEEGKAKPEEPSPGPGDVINPERPVGRKDLGAGRGLEVEGDRGPEGKPPKGTGRPDATGGRPATPDKGPGRPDATGGRPATPDKGPERASSPDDRGERASTAVEKKDGKASSGDKGTRGPEKGRGSSVEEPRKSAP